MLAALQSELDAIARDDGSARLSCSAAAGKAFCAGHDLKEMRAEPSLDYYERLFAPVWRMMLAIQRLPVPVIARVHGIATAAGCQLVAMCDLAVAAAMRASPSAGVNLGLFCATPSVALSRNLGRKAAFEMLVTGDFISADEALAKGLVNRVVPAEASWTPRWNRWWRHRGQAARRAGHGQGAVLPAAGEGHRGGLRRRGPRPWPAT
jgi:enoyl-CoA hydratase/carnithine racemase